MAKTVITSVGTSVFDHSNAIGSKREIIRNKPYNEMNIYKKDVEVLINSVTKELLQNKSNYSNDDVLDKTSAEIKSLYKIYNKVGEDLEVYLLASDTLEGYAAAQIIKSYIEEIFPKWRVVFNEARIIKGLQVKDADLFQTEGMGNLINAIDSICGGYYDDKLLNITGGYKVVIPFLSILGQIWGIPIFYTFEEEQNLITIPRIPIQIDTELFSKYADIFEKLNGVISYADWRNLEQRIHYEDREAIKSFILELDDMLGLSPVGRIFWSKYREGFYVLYLSRQAEEVIEQAQIKPLLDKFLVPSLRKERLHSLENVPPDVRCFKLQAGDSGVFRVIYKERNGQLQIYRIYLDHNDYERDIGSIDYESERLNIYEYKR